MNKLKVLVALMLLALLCATGCNNISDRSAAFSDGLIEAINKYRIGSGMQENLIEVSTKVPTTKQDGRSCYLYGAIDFSGNVVIPLKYEKLYIRLGNCNDVVVVANNDKYGLVNIHGKEVLPCQYDQIFRFYGNYAIVFDNGRYGIVDNQGNVVVPIIHEGIRAFYENYHYLIGGEKTYHFDDVFYVRDNGVEKVINLTRQKTGGSRKDRIDSPYDYQRIERNGKSGFVNYRGEEIPCQFENARDTFAQNLVAVVHNSKIGFIDKVGGVAIPFQYDYTEFSFNYHSIRGYAMFSEGLCVMKNNQKFGYIDKRGDVVISYKYDLAKEFHRGKAIVGIEENGTGKLGLIDKSGSCVVPLEYESILYNKVGLYIVEKNKKKGVMDLNGAVIVPIDYDDIHFLDNYGYVLKNGKYGLINNQGDLLLPCEYGSIPLAVPSYDMALVEKDKKKGVVNFNNEVVLPMEFDHVFENFNCSLTIIEKDGVFGVSDWQGNYYLPK